MAAPKNKPSSFDALLFTREAARHRVLTREEEVELARLSKGTGKEAHRAKEEMFHRNMRLVLNSARTVGGNSSFYPDLVQEASIGLMHAIEKFDPEKGFRFATYASWWIRQAVNRYCHYSGEIRLPANVSWNKNVLDRILQKDPHLTDEAILELTGFTKPHLKQLRNLPKIELSIDAKRYDGSEESEGDFLADPNSVNAFDECSQEETWRILTELLEGLPKRDVEIFRAWLSEEGNLSELGVAWGLSRERVRQIVLAVSNKIRVHFGVPPVRRSRRIRSNKGESDS